MRLFNVVIRTKYGYGFGVVDLSKKYTFRELDKICDGLYFNDIAMAKAQLMKKNGGNNLPFYDEVFG